MVLQWAHVDKLLGIFYHLSEISLEESYKGQLCKCLFLRQKFLPLYWDPAKSSLYSFIPAREVENAGGCQNGCRKEAKKDSSYICGKEF